ncbi:pentapeptide repeat-containing protein [Curtobacterium sp. MR_MD2014]|uniref:pentapeptide repeat-containing protein n=1 Tax=Curtobacterium sp. MR_MD2014 TaxID=1561023 RepID=UPI00082F4947|nr:pentapeptide repeat-containing protein [Curtobacterium sp. MR_MD2014]
MTERPTEPDIGDTIAGDDPTIRTGQVRPRLSRRHWSVALVVLVVAVLAVGYEFLSAPNAQVIGACRVVAGASPASHTECSGDDLAGRDLSGIDLRLADLSGADLRGADLDGAILYGADLSGADLSGARVRDADLTQADLSGATLSDTDFTRAGINGMNVEDTVLAASTFSEWVTDSDPVQVTLTAGTQPGIEKNTCAKREGLFYPGQNGVTCTLSTAAEYDGTLEYTRNVEVKLPPQVDVPSTVALRVGQQVSVQFQADSPFPAVVTAFSASLPAGLSWDPETLTVTGVPERAGTTKVEFIADNGKQVRTPVTFRIGR